MSSQIKELFSTIYPNNPEYSKLMCFDEKTDKHISTKVAIINNKIVGQANIFLINDENIANLGYHIHPDYHRKGIGKKLSEEVIKIAKRKGIEILLIRTNQTNISSIKLGEKLGFIKPNKEFLKKHEEIIKHKNIKNIVCLCKKLQKK